MEHNLGKNIKNSRQGTKRNQNNNHGTLYCASARIRKINSGKNQERSSASCNNKKKLYWKNKRQRQKAKGKNQYKMKLANSLAQNAEQAKRKDVQNVNNKTTGAKRRKRNVKNQNSRNSSNPQPHPFHNAGKQIECTTNQNASGQGVKRRKQNAEENHSPSKKQCCHRREYGSTQTMQSPTRSSIGNPFNLPVTSWGGFSSPPKRFENHPLKTSNFKKENDMDNLLNSIRYEPIRFTTEHIFSQPREEFNKSLKSDNHFTKLENDAYIHHDSKDIPINKISNNKKDCGITSMVDIPLFTGSSHVKKESKVSFTHPGFVQSKNNNKGKANSKVNICGKRPFFKTQTIRKYNTLGYLKKTSIPAYILKNVKLRKYWERRRSLFSKFDKGILMNEESWYSVTPEKIAKEIAKYCSCDIVIDAFCGVGGNTIQLAMTCKRVIAIDINPKMIAMARHNAAIYGVTHKIEFIVGDFLKLAPSLQADVVFLSPPWGGMDYKRKNYHLTSLQPVSGQELYNVTKKISENIAMYLPKGVNQEECGQP